MVLPLAEKMPNDTRKKNHHRGIMLSAALLILALLALLHSPTFPTLTTVIPECETANDPPKADAVSSFVPTLTCEAMTEEKQAMLQKEIADYETSVRFQSKIDEVRGKRRMDTHHASIKSYLYEKVLHEDIHSVLELGCAAGMMLKVAYEWYDTADKRPDVWVGLELVTGWVTFAQDYFPNELSSKIHVFEGDMTEFSLPQPYEHQTFDFIMLNDVLEHLDRTRYGCFFDALKRVTHAGSIVYAHTPTPEAQLVDRGQFIENALPHHILIAGMQTAGFELVAFEMDVGTRCSNSYLIETAPKIIKNTRCAMGGWTKYTHAVFYRPKDERVLSIN